MTALTGTAALVRFVLRRDRVRIAVWVLSIVLLVQVSASSIESVYPTAEDLRRAAALVEDNPAAIAFNGPVQGLETIGGRVAFEAGSFGLVLVALMTLFMVTRLTRAEEETGRLDLVRSTTVGRHAPLATALLVVGGMNVVVGALVAAVLLWQDLPATGSVVFGLSFTVLGLVFAALAAVAAQVTENTRVASGLVGAAVGLAFTLRAAGDIGDGTLSWLSPIGWAQKTRPFAGEAWWPFGVSLAGAGALVVLAVQLAVHRDVGGGLVPARPGPATASPALGRPLGLAFRLQRGSLFWWSVGVLGLGLVYGAVADDIEDFVEDNEAVADFLARSGAGSLTDAFLATTLLILALIGSGYAVQSALRLRGEESSLRAEPLLVAGAGRWAWTRSHLVLALGGSAFVVAAGGFGVGLAYGVVAGDLGQVPRLVASSFVYVPAMWLLVGVALALFGVVPRATAMAWAALAVCFVLGFFGEPLDLPSWVLQVSPFEHAPLVPGQDLRPLPLVVTAAIAVGMVAVGVVGFERRDVG